MHPNFGPSFTPGEPKSAPAPQSPTPEPPAPTSAGSGKGVFMSVLSSFAFAGALVALILWLTADLREQTHIFLGHVRAHRDDDAYALTTRAFQQQVPRSAFSAYLDLNARGARSSSGEWINGSSGGFSDACMDVWLHDTSAGTLYVLFHKENDIWRVADVTHVEVSQCDSD